MEDVNEFLDQVAKEMEQLLRENMELKEQIHQLNEKLKSYQKLEETMHNAILVARKPQKEVKQNANREADLIRREAEREAQRIIEDARYRSSRCWPNMKSSSSRPRSSNAFSFFSRGPAFRPGNGRLDGAAAVDND